jgi:molybdate transport system substrate-binding protein
MAASRTPLARTGLAIAIRDGGVAFAALIQRLGIADNLKAKSKLTATGEEVGQLVVRGEAEFSVLPVSEILPVRGAELLGTFPDDT